MHFTKPQIIFLAVAGTIVLLIALVFLGVLPGRRQAQPTRPNIVVWGPIDSKAMQSAIRGFRNTYPGVNIKYEEVDAEGYENTLINAMAAGTGPDVFMMDDSWLGIHQDKLVPMPPERMALATFEGFFPQVAEENLVRDDAIYGLPMSVDTLALVYNRDIFDQAKVVYPPSTWSELQTTVSKINVFKSGKLSRAGAALGGTSDTIVTAPEILTAMFMQNEVPMVNERIRTGAFSSGKGINTFTYYVDFTKKGAQQSWDQTMGDAVEAFADGNVGMIFGYPHQLTEIKAKNPLVNAMVAPLPQFNPENAINVADYWALAVSNGSLHSDIAWDFVVFAATNEKSVQTYATVTGRTPALRSLIKSLLGDPVAGIAASQALTARSWPKPGDENVKEVFDRAIGATLSGELRASPALDRAAAEITKLLEQ